MSQRAAVAMTPSEIDEFLAGRRVMTMATLGRDGRPHLVAMWYGFTRDGRIGLATYATSQKIRNLERSPFLTGLIEDGEGYDELRGVQLVANAVVSRDRDLVNEIGESLYERYHAAASGPLTDDVRPFVHASVAKRAAVVLDVVETVSWDHAKLVAR